MQLLLFTDGGGEGPKAAFWFERFSISPRQSSNTLAKQESGSVENVWKSGCLPTFKFFFALVSIHAALFSFASSCASVGSICRLKEKSQHRGIETPPSDKLTIVVGPIWIQRSHKGLAGPHKS